MDYTEEQLIQIKDNLNLVSLCAIKILQVISSQKEITHSDIYVKANVSRFITDKCIASFLVSGLVNRIDDGVRRYFNITESGRKLLQLGGEKKNEVS